MPGFSPHAAPTAADATTVWIAGRPCTRFGGCDYLGLAHHPRVVAAAVDAIGRYGLSTSASRTTTGETAEHAALEIELAAFLGYPAALLLPDGYTANIAAAQTLARTCGAAVLDERAHPSLFDAAATARMPTLTYRHLDAEDAARVASAAGGDVAIFTDGVFTADGVIAPLAGLVEALPTAGSRLVVDDCHGFCVLAGGRGTPAHLGITDHRIVATTTLAKGLGCAGGAVLGQASFIDDARRHSTAFICTTPASPALAAAARSALQLVAEDPELVRTLTANSARVALALRKAGIDTPTKPTPIFAFTAGSSGAMEHLEAMLRERGLIVPLMAYPGGPAPVYFRLSVSASHTPEQIDGLAAALHDLVGVGEGVTA